MKWFFYRIFELILATLIQRYDKKNHFTLTTRDSLKVYRLSGAIFYDCMNTIYKFIKPVLGNKMFILRNMEPLNKCYVWRCERDLRITRLLMLILLHSLERLIESPHWVVSLSFLTLVCLLFLRLFRKWNLTHSLLFLVMSMYLSVKIGTTTWSIFSRITFFQTHQSAVILVFTGMTS